MKKTVVLTPTPSTVVVVRADGSYILLTRRAR